MNKKMRTDIVVLADRETWTEIADSKVILNIEIDSEFHYYDDFYDDPEYDNGNCETLLVQDLVDFWKQHHPTQKLDESLFTELNNVKNGKDTKIFLPFLRTTSKIRV